ncbi:MAG: methionine--tRNA ligase [Candidatus Marinimicrobia bacterium]|nr:methionine--tRNA ligase [Candidatus Neomarinimicrobiota bacterium]
MGKFYITTPIYYVNDQPHLGHAYTTILADVLVRYHRTLGDETHFLTGTDEHGLKVQQAALERGADPQAHTDEFVVRFKEMWQRLNISHDDFIRTTEPRHKEVVTRLLQDLYDKGEIYQSEYEGWYSVSEERFITQKEVDSGAFRQVEQVKEKNWFFRMSDYQDRLIEYIENNPKFIQPDSRRNEVLGFLRQPLEDLCISRPKSRLTWGIELPFDKDYVNYVWFDALTNYISAIGYTEDDERFKKWWPADYHLIGKDILTTHAVYWPTMLMAAGMELPKTIFAHGWWLMGEGKMSKSLGNVVRPLDLIDQVGVDPVRYYLMRDMVLGQDASFTTDSFRRRYNADLANDLGNLVNRIAKFIRKNFDGELPRPIVPEDTAPDDELKAEAARIVALVPEQIEAMRLHEAVETSMELVRKVNGYLEQRQPWHQIKTDKELTGSTLYHAAEALRLALQLLHPVMPTKVDMMRQMIGADEIPLTDFIWGGLRPGTALGEGESPFPRLEKLEAAQPQEAPAKDDGLITFDEFQQADLRIAKIIKADVVKGANKLLKLRVSLGNSERQIIAGIAQHYDVDELPGMLIVMVANLEPATIRGEESQGMLLAAEDKDGQLVLATVDDPNMAPGAKVG